MPGFFPLEPPGDSGPYLLIVDDHPSFVQTLVRAIGSSAGRSAVASLQIRSIAWVSNEDEARAFLADPGRIGLVLLQANLGEGVRRQRRGLRLLEMGLADGTLSCPVLLMSLENPEVLLHDADHGYFMDIRQRFGLQSYSLRLPISLTAPDGTGLVDLLRSLSLDTTRQQFALADEESTRVVRRKKLEAENHRYRHDFINCRSAVRVLLGAMQAGDVSSEKGQEILARLEQRENWATRKATDDSSFNVGVLQRYLETVPNQPPPRSAIKKVLLIDDQHDMSGWGLVLQAIFEGLSAECCLVTAGNGEEGLEQVDGSADGFDVALVDIDLSRGGGRLNGLEVLRELKQRQFDLPIIMLTAYDRAALTMTCLRFGAFDYFVKAREDPLDRNSLDYYRKLREIILQVPLWDSEERHLWRKFVALEPQISALDGRLRPHQLASGETIGGYLRKAYFFLTLDHRDSRGRELLLPDPIADQGTEMRVHLIESVVNAWLAVDHLLNGEAHRLSVEIPVLLDLYNRFMRLRSRSGNLLKGINASDFKTLTRYGSAMKHSGLMAQDLRRIDQSPSDAPSCLEEALTVVEKYLSKAHLNPITLSAKTVSGESLRLDEYVPADDPQFSHFARGQQSAIRLLVGAHLAKVREASDDPKEWRELLATINRADLKALIRDWQFNSSQVGRSKQVLFIDDRGEDSWWDLVLQALLTQWGAGVQWESGPGKLTKTFLEQFDAVLLDLKLPTVEDGFDALKMIRREAFALPVAILTASDDAVHVKQCLALGADEYFLKAAIAETDIPATRYYADFQDLADRLFTQDRSSKRRQLWDRLTAFRERNRWGGILVGPTLLGNLESHYGRMGFTPQDGDVAIRLQLCPASYLRKAYFFLVCAGDGATSDAWRIQRLLLGGNGTVEEAVVNCGKAVEYLVQHLPVVDPTVISQVGESGDAGAILQAETSFLSRQTRVLGRPIWSRRNDLLHSSRAGQPVTDTEAADLFEKTIRFADAFREEFLDAVRKQADAEYKKETASIALPSDVQPLLQQFEAALISRSMNTTARDRITLHLHCWIRGVVVVKTQSKFGPYVSALGSSLLTEILQPIAYQPLMNRKRAEVSTCRGQLQAIEANITKVRRAIEAAEANCRDAVQRLEADRARQATLLAQSTETIRTLQEQQYKLAQAPQAGSNRRIVAQLGERLQCEERTQQESKAALADLEHRLQTVSDQASQDIASRNVALQNLLQQKEPLLLRLEREEIELAEIVRCCSVVDPVPAEDHVRCLMTHDVLSQTQADHLTALSDQLTARNVPGAITQSAELIRSFLPTPQRPP